MTDELTLRTIDLPETRGEEQTAFMEAVRFGFNDSRMTDEIANDWYADLRRQQSRPRGIYREVPAGVLGGPVATFTSFDGRLNTGNGHLAPANFITDVTVRTTHRRRGLLRQLMTADLTEAAERGLPFATLTASEGTIYGRFGFGVSTLHASIELNTRAGFGFHAPVTGTVEAINPQDEAIKDAREQLYEQVLVQRRGAHSRQPWYRNWLSGAFDYDEGGENRKIRAVAHYDESGRLDGVVAYSFGKWDEPGTVNDLVTVNANAELALWQFIADIDLRETWTCSSFDPASPLRWALTDPRRVKITSVRDCTWLRILDAEQALSLRGWERDGEMVVGVSDPMGFASGNLRVEVNDGESRVVRTDEEAEVTMGVAELGSLYFGAVDLSVLAQAGRVQGTPEAVANASRMFEVDEAPYNTSHF